MSPDCGSAVCALTVCHCCVLSTSRAVGMLLFLASDKFPALLGVVMFMTVAIQAVTLLAVVYAIVVQLCARYRIFGHLSCFAAVLVAILIATLVMQSVTS